MKTDDLIIALTADAGRVRRPMDVVLEWLTVAACVAAALVFAATIGPRADIGEAATTGRFLFKFVVTIALAGSAFWLLLRLNRPGAAGRRDLVLLAAAPALLLLAVAAEFFSVPQAQWAMTAMGKNSFNCLTWIPLIGIGPLALLLPTLRHGAPTRPALSGAVTGLLAGGIAATFYAANCTDDSPFFVVTWYPLAIAMLAAVGAAAGKLIARW
ncbi:NrsF family protein [Devosia nitrariae]|uniref:DUF1109 family protein n=1 Tax=Devosia nitrariae TaxID=2071872 RepID=A0ABQ5VZU7_9HYPH|nr:NrsF family protein [Devosia nitrariae]GLQ53134.1 hypothetical protein GCM10010862_03920 [Devosia nitrariae]